MWLVKFAVDLPFLILTETLASSFKSEARAQSMTKCNKSETRKHKKFYAFGLVLEKDFMFLDPFLGNKGPTFWAR